MYQIYTAKDEPLSSIPDHTDIEGIFRTSLLKSPHKLANISHMAVHKIDGLADPHTKFRYTKPHQHDHDELNIILPGDHGLTYLYEVGDERFHVTEQATVFIPAGVPHRMEAMDGSGTFVCMHLET